MGGPKEAENSPGSPAGRSFRVEGEDDSYLVICWALLSLLVPFRGAWRWEEGGYISLGAAPCPRTSLLSPVQQSEPQGGDLSRGPRFPKAKPKCPHQAPSLPHAWVPRLSPAIAALTALGFALFWLCGFWFLVHHSSQRLQGRERSGGAGRGGWGGNGVQAAVPGASRTRSDESTPHSRFSCRPALSCAPCWP